MLRGKGVKYNIYILKQYRAHKTTFFKNRRQNTARPAGGAPLFFALFRDFLRTGPPWPPGELDATAAALADDRHTAPRRQRSGSRPCPMPPPLSPFALPPAPGRSGSRRPHRQRRPRWQQAAPRAAVLLRRSSPPAPVAAPPRRRRLSAFGFSFLRSRAAGRQQRTGQRAGQQGRQSGQELTQCYDICGMCQL